MNEIYEKVKAKLSLIENMYDINRIIDPLNKTIINVTNNKIKKLDGKCYDILSRDIICTNCISMRAYMENDTFIKIEYAFNGVILIIATTVTINKEKYVVEIIKDISSQNNKISNISNYYNNISSRIDDINEKIVRDDLTGLYNRIYIEGRLPVDVNNSVINKYLFSVIMIDIDNFKSINYEYGQDIGDSILKDFAKLMSDSVAANSCWIGRYSGKKFIIALNYIDKEEACKISLKMKTLLKNSSFEYDDKIIKLKINFAIYSSENELIDIKGILVDLEKSIFEEKEKRVVEEIRKDRKLSELNYKIEELRSILNEMCISSDQTAEYEHTLKISQDLDELIVEYMKNM